MGLVLQAICMSLKHALATKTYKKYYNLIFYFYFQNIFQKYRKIKFSMHFIIHMPISRFLLLISF